MADIEMPIADSIFFFGIKAHTVRSPLQRIMIRLQPHV